MHLSTSNHDPYPKPQRKPTPLTCPHRVLLRVALGQTDRRSGPKRPGIAPTPSRRKQPRHCLQGRARPHAPPFFLWNPDFYYNKAPKPHSKLKKAQTTLREKQLSYKLQLGGESDNPTSKGIPQPPLWRRSVRGALCEARPRGWLAPFVFPRSFGFR